MRRRNEVLDKVDHVKEELDRLYHRIPIDVNTEFDLQLRIIRGLQEQLDLIMIMMNYLNIYLTICINLQ